MESPDHTRAYSTRIAFSLVEIVVSLVIIGVLLALLIPAVQQVRSRARATTCQNNLHQLGVAIAGFEQTHGVIPTWFRMHGRHETSLVPLLPYLDQGPLFEQMKSPQIVVGRAGVQLEVLLCPDDGLGWDDYGRLNYAFNAGSRWIESFPEGSGVLTMSARSFTDKGGLRLREVQDGLSNTAAMSERLLAGPLDPSAESPSPEILERETGRYLWYTTRSDTDFGQEELAASTCRTETTTPLRPHYGPTAGDLRFLPEGYLHLLPPNHRGCYNATDWYDFDPSNARRIIPPSSHHAGGVHLLMCDGQVRFVSDTIGDAPWLAAGTRAGGESEVLK